jgi:hypothetical protein
LSEAVAFIPASKAPQIRNRFAFIRPPLPAMLV